MEVYDSPAFQKVVNAAGLVTSGGVPLVWALRRMRYPDQARVYGLDLMMHIVEWSAEQGVAVGFLGGKSDVLEELVTRLRARFSALKVQYQFSPVPAYLARRR